MMRAALASRIEGIGARWAQRRQGKDLSSGFVLERRRIYILPTRYGAIFAVVLFAMLLGSINYSANLAYAMTFLLVGLLLVILNHCHNNLLRLKLRFAGAEPVFAGDTALFRIAISNESTVTRHEIEVALPRSSNLPVTLPANGSDFVRLRVPTRQRGWLSLNRFNVATHYPTSLFRAWTWVYMDARCLVYPQPAGRGVPLPSSDGGRQRRGMLERDDADFHGLREAQVSDSPNRIAWKAYARNGELLTKQFRGSEGNPCMLDWDATPGANAEARISQLTRWCLDAHDQARSFGLRIPGTHIALGRGERHLHACLKALALLEVNAP
jgi:uncharacterized protein (DUF58 family)